MRRTWPAAGLATVLALSVLGAAHADEPTPHVPSREQVADAQRDVNRAVGDVESVQAALDAANQRLEASAVAAAQAAEAFNGARWRARQARIAADLARTQAAAAEAEEERHAEAYADVVVTSYESMPELSALTAVLESDDLGTALDRSSSLENAGQALDSRHEDYEEAADAAQAARDRAETAEEDAVAAKVAARTARDDARAAADTAAFEAQAVAGEKERLVAELARLQGISVALAERRQAGLEERAQQIAAAQAEAEADAEPATEPPAADPAPVAPADQPPAPDPAPEEPEPEQPEQPDPSPPAVGGGAQQAIAFARAQLGEPYRWGAEGPSSWDCSGLTMGAWQAGGKSLPHYSVAQYQQSTPISSSQLRPGDLVFWGSSSRSSSIFHVALYVGDGKIIHAPRTGRPVTEESMYYWITPNFYARP